MEAALEEEPCTDATAATVSVRADWADILATGIEALLAEESAPSDGLTEATWANLGVAAFELEFELDPFLDDLFFDLDLDLRMEEKNEDKRLRLGDSDLSEPG